MCCSLYSTFITLFILWFDHGFAIHLDSRSLLLIMVILVIGCHWYLPHESKFIDVWFVVIEFTTILYYEEKWTHKVLLSQFFLTPVSFFFPKPSSSFLFKYSNLQIFKQSLRELLLVVPTFHKLHWGDQKEKHQRRGQKHVSEKLKPYSF